jgi:hypothetical protein
MGKSTTMHKIDGGNAPSIFFYLMIIIRLLILLPVNIVQNNEKFH